MTIGTERLKVFGVIVCVVVVAVMYVELNTMLRNETTSLAMVAKLCPVGALDAFSPELTCASALVLAGSIGSPSLHFQTNRAA